jgi:hypothetical protein
MDNAMPKRVSLAVKIICVGIGIGLFNSIFNYNEIMMAAYAKTGVTLASSIYVLIVLFSLAIPAFLLWKISQRKNWARITLLVLLILGTYSIVKILGEMLSGGVVLNNLLSVLAACTQYVGVYLFFTGESNEWFRKIQ